MNDVASWAVTTSQGIILIGALNDYAVEDEVIGGLTKLGLDPKQIKYVLISHGHVTHFGGARFLQDALGARIGVSDADWDLIEESESPVSPNFRIRVSEITDAESAGVRLETSMSSGIRAVNACEASTMHRSSPCMLRKRTMQRARKSRQT